MAETTQRAPVSRHVEERSPEGSGRTSRLMQAGGIAVFAAVLVILSFVLPPLFTDAGDETGSPGGHSPPAGESTDGFGDPGGEAPTPAGQPGAAGGGHAPPAGGHAPAGG